MTNEETITEFLQTQYSDERLAMLLAHTEDGKLAFLSCCCFAGVPTATHALQGENCSRNLGDHKTHPDWSGATRGNMSSAYFGLAPADEERRAKLVPLIKAEMQRREEGRVELRLPSSSPSSLPPPVSQPAPTPITQGVGK